MLQSENVKVALKTVLRYTTKCHRPLAKEAGAVLAGVDVSSANNGGVGVGGRLSGRSPLRLFDPVVDRGVVGTEDDALQSRQGLHDWQWMPTSFPTSYRYSR